MDNSAVTTIRTVVNKARAAGRIPEERDLFCVQHALDGMRRLSLFNLPHKNTTKVSLDSLGRVYFPQDCLRFLSLSVPQYGRNYTFTQDKTLVQSTDKTYAYESFDTAYGEGQGVNDAFVVSYGKGGQNEIVFSVNERLRYAQIVGFAGTECTMTYVSSGITESPDGVELPKTVEPALIAYILWRDSEYDLSLPISERQFREQKYWAEADDLDMVNYAPTKEQIMDEYYKHLYQTVKR